MLKGKTALITGSTSGIGLGIARALAARAPTSSSMVSARRMRFRVLRTSSRVTKYERCITART